MNILLEFSSLVLFELVIVILIDWFRPLVNSSVLSWLQDILYSFVKIQSIVLVD